MVIYIPLVIYREYIQINITKDSVESVDYQTIMLTIKSIKHRLEHNVLLNFQLNY